jgi:curved DNA-binding protein
MAWSWASWSRKRELKDYYSLLGLSPAASQKQIQKAFRRKAAPYHPDISKDPRAKEKFQEYVEAYQALKSPDKRDDYDAQIIAEFCRSAVGTFDMGPEAGPQKPVVLRVLQKGA